MSETIFDLIIIGAGPGGYVAAIKGAQAGLNTAVIENRRVGGTCLNRGCIPAKAMIHASSLYREALEGERFGLHVREADFDYGEILAYKQECIDGLVGGVEQLLKANGVTLIQGTGTLLAPEGGMNRVRVKTASSDDEEAPAAGCSQESGLDERGPEEAGADERRPEVAGSDERRPEVAGSDERGPEEAGAGEGDSDRILQGKNVILATGSRPARIPVPGLDLPGVVDSDGLFALDHPPKSLVIIGGGVIGVEFATVYANLGSEVTILEALPRLLDNFDKEISQNLKMILKKRGIESHLNAAVKEVRRTSESREEGSGAEGLTVSFEEKGSLREISADCVLVAAGRHPVTEGLFGEELAVNDIRDAGDAGAGSEGVPPEGAIPLKSASGRLSGLLMRGRYVAVDDAFRTSMPGVYAIGDLTGGIQLAHAASAQGARVIEEIRGGVADQEQEPPGDTPAFAQRIDVIPAGVYTDPEIAMVGMTEAQAKEQGVEVKTGKFIMSANGKSLITREERGFIKVVADAASGRLLGAQMMCARATDMIGEFATAIVNGLTAGDLLRSVRPHPTYNEGVAEALEDVFGESVHTAPRKRR